MQKKEKTLCTFTQKGIRLQLIELIYKNAAVMTNTAGEPTAYDLYKYQVRLNRKIVSKSLFEYNERKVFVTYCQNIVTQP